MGGATFNTCHPEVDTDNFNFDPKCGHLLKVDNFKYGIFKKIPNFKKIKGKEKSPRLWRPYIHHGDYSIRINGF